MADGATVFIVGCGYVGSRVAALELAALSRVAALARSEQSARKLIDLGVHPVAGDLDSPDSLRAMPTAGAILYYFAPPPPLGTDDPRLAALLNGLTQTGLPQRVVYISTSGVYGDCQGGWIDETWPLNAQSDRAKRRVAAELLLRQWTVCTGVATVILRVPGIYGPGRLPVERIRQGRPVVREDEASFTNRIHADDLAAVCKLAAHIAPAGAIYNVSDGHPTSMTDYFNQIADRLDLPRPPQVSMEEARRTFDPGMLSFLEESKRLDNRRMLNELGARLRYPTLAAGLASCLP